MTHDKDYEDRIRITKNEILNRYFSGHIKTPLDIYNFVSSYYPEMPIKEVSKIVEDMRKNGRFEEEK